MTKQYRYEIIKVTAEVVETTETFVVRASNADAAYRAVENGEAVARHTETEDVAVLREDNPIIVSKEEA